MQPQKKPIITDRLFSWRGPGGLFQLRQHVFHRCLDFRIGGGRATARRHGALALDHAGGERVHAQTNALLAGADWLAAKADPQARFISTHFTPDGPGRYWLNGTFSVKGHSQPLRVQVSTHPEGKDLIMDAAFKLDRTAFGLGTGSWADTSVVAAAIPVQVHLVVSPQ